MIFIMLPRLSFVMSQKRGILMSQSVSFMTPQKLNKQFVTNSGFYNAQHVIAMSFPLKLFCSICWILKIIKKLFYIRHFQED